MIIIKKEFDFHNFAEHQCSVEHRSRTSALKLALLSESEEHSREKL